MKAKDVKRIEKLLTKFELEGTIKEVGTLAQVIVLTELRDSLKADLEDCYERKAVGNLVAYISSLEVEIKTKLKRLKDGIGYEDSDH